MLDIRALTPCRSPWTIPSEWMYWRPSATSSIWREWAMSLKSSDNYYYLTSLRISDTGGFWFFLQSVSVPFVMNGDTRYNCDFFSNIPNRGRIKRCVSDRHARASRQKSWLSESLARKSVRSWEKNGNELTSDLWPLSTIFSATSCPLYLPLKTRPKPPTLMGSKFVLTLVINKDLGITSVDISLSISFLAFLFVSWASEFGRVSSQAS